MEEEHATHDGGEPAQCPDHIHQGELAPLPEEDGRSRDGEGGEHDVIDGRDQRGVEDVQGPVEVVHLHQDAANHGRHKEPGEGVEELRVPTQGQLDGDAESFAGHDGEGANQGADGHVDEDVGLAVLGGHPEDEVDRDADGDEGVENEACGGRVGGGGEEEEEEGRKGGGGGEEEEEKRGGGGGGGEEGRRRRRRRRGEEE